MKEKPLLLALVAALAASTAFAQSMPDVTPERTTHRALLAPDVACPAGQVGISMAWRDSPRYDPHVVFFSDPPRVTGCLDLEGTPVPRYPFVIVVHFADRYTLLERP